MTQLTPLYQRLIGLLFLTSALLPAQDLVVNGGFESFTSCPATLGEITLAAPWAISGGTPDLYHRCAPPGLPIAVPDNFIGFQQPRAGDGYAGLVFAPGDIGRAREFMTTGLREPLIAGACYYLEFYVVLGELSQDNCDGFGVLVSTEIPELGLIRPPTPQFNYNQSVTDREGWTLISGTLTANGDERFLAIGNFDGCNGREISELPFIYYFIDEIKLFQVEEEATRDIYLCGDSDDCYTFNDVDYCDPGTYVIPLGDVAQPGCPTEVTLNIFRDAPLDITINEMPVYDCFSDSYRLRVDNPGDVPELTYAWTGPNGFTSSLEEPLVSRPGTYTLTATNNGCSTTDTYLLEAGGPARLTLNLAKDGDLNCFTTTTNLSALTGRGGLDYAWSGPGFSSPDSTISVTLPGTYSVTVTQPGQPCTATDSIRVTRSTELEEPVLLRDGALNCEGDSVRLSVGNPTAGLAYRWTGPGGATLGPSVTVTEAGTYLLSAVGGPGCTTSGEISVSRPPPLTAGAEISDYLCTERGGSLVATDVTGGTPPYLYGLTSEGLLVLDSIFTGLEPGSYDLAIVDARGCGDTLRNLLIRELPRPEILLPELPILRRGDSIRIDPLLNFPEAEVATVNWGPDDQLGCLDCLRPVFTARRSTVLTVTIDLENGCSLTDSVAVRVVPPPNLLYIPSAFSPGRADGINDYFTVFTRSSEPATLLRFEIFDRWGAQVFSRSGIGTNDPTEGWDGQFSGRPSPAGVYVFSLRLRFPDGTEEERSGSLVLVR